jgi:hypothetical protein
MWELDHSAPIALMRSVGVPPRSKAGLLTCSSSRSGGLPVDPTQQWPNNASPLAAYSGATARDFHPLPFSLTD